MKYLLVLSFSLSLLASASQGPGWQEWRKRFDDLQKDSAVLTAEGEIEANQLRAQSQSLRFARFEKLAAIQSLQQDKADEAERDASLAQASVREAEEKLRLAKLEASAPPMDACKTGSESECQALADLFQGRLQYRRALAAIAVDRAKAELKLAETRYQNQSRLAGSHAVKVEVLKEMELSLNARRRDLTLAQAQLSLADASLLP